MWVYGKEWYSQAKSRTPWPQPKFPLFMPYQIKAWMEPYCPHISLHPLANHIKLWSWVSTNGKRRPHDLCQGEKPCTILAKVVLSSGWVLVHPLSPRETALSNDFHFDLVFLCVPLRLSISSNACQACTLLLQCVPGLTFLPQTPKYLRGQCCTSSLTFMLSVSFLCVHQNYVECRFWQFVSPGM